MRFNFDLRKHFIHGFKHYEEHSLLFHKTPHLLPEIPSFFGDLYLLYLLSPSVFLALGVLSIFTKNLWILSLSSSVHRWERTRYINLSRTGPSGNKTDKLVRKQLCKIPPNVTNHD